MDSIASSYISKSTDYVLGELKKYNTELVYIDNQLKKSLTKPKRKELISRREIVLERYEAAKKILISKGYSVSGGTATKSSTVIKNSSTPSTPSISLESALAVPSDSSAYPYAKQSDQWLMNVINTVGPVMRQMSIKLNDANVSSQEKQKIEPNRLKITIEKWSPAKENLEKRGYTVEILRPSLEIKITAPVKKVSQPVATAKPAAAPVKAPVSVIAKQPSVVKPNSPMVSVVEPKPVENHETDNVEQPIQTKKSNKMIFLFGILAAVGIAYWYFKNKNKSAGLTALQA